MAIDNERLAKLKADVSKAADRCLDAENRIEDAKADLQHAEEWERHARAALSRFYATQPAENIEDAVAIIAQHDAWGTVVDGRTVLTDGHAMAIVDGHADSRSVPDGRDLAAATVATIADAVRRDLGSVDAATIAAAAAAAEGDPDGLVTLSVRVGAACVNAKLLRTWLVPLMTGSGDAAVNVRGADELDAVEFVGSAWRAFIMPMRDVAPQRVLVEVQP